MDTVETLTRALAAANAIIGQQADEMKKLQDEACLIRGAIEELAIGVRSPHWLHHFTVYGPPGPDGLPIKHAVPWDWALPPFELVRQHMDEMGDYGTRTNRQAQEAYLLRMELEEAQEDQKRLNHLIKHARQGHEKYWLEIGVPHWMSARAAIDKEIEGSK